MFRGETIVTTITGFPIPISEIKNLYIIFRNRSEIVLEKTLADCDIVYNGIEFSITQEESLRLISGTINRSVIVITNDGSRFESRSSPFVCKDTAKDEVLYE